MAQPHVSSETEIISLAISLSTLIARHVVLALVPLEIEGSGRFLVELLLLVLCWITVSYRTSFTHVTVWILNELWTCVKSNPTAVLNLIPPYFLVFVMAASEKNENIIRQFYGLPQSAESYGVAVAAMTVNTVATFRCIYMDTEPRSEGSQEPTAARGFYRVVLVALTLLMPIYAFARLSPFEREADMVLTLLCVYVCVRLGQLLYKEFN